MNKLLDWKFSLEWLIDKLWPIFWLAAGGSITKAAIDGTENIQTYGPLATLALVIIGSFSFLCLYYLIQIATKARLTNKRVADSIGSSYVNPLESEFSKATVHLKDFYDPYYFPHKNKSFVNCKIVGPGNILMLGGSITSCNISHCQIVVIKENISIVSVVVLDNCAINKCSLNNCTFFMGRATYQMLPQNMKDSIPVLNG